MRQTDFTIGKEVVCYLSESRREIIVNAMNVPLWYTEFCGMYGAVLGDVGATTWEGGRDEGKRRLMQH